MRDVPESAIKPPIVGKLARQWRPGKLVVCTSGQEESIFHPKQNELLLLLGESGLGVFQGGPIGSRPGGM